VFNDFVSQTTVTVMEDMVLQWQLEHNNGLPEGVEMPPTEDDLPFSDGRPMETQKHRLQMEFLIVTLERHWHERGREDAYVGGNMGVYYSVEQARAQNFRAPDFFLVLNTTRRVRKSWVIWQEGRAPNLVIELLSESTKAADRGIKKQIYQDFMRVHEYVLHDVMNNSFEAFRLTPATDDDPTPHYEPVELVRTTGNGTKTALEPCFVSPQLGLELVLWEGEYGGYWETWLRWRDSATGELLFTFAEVAREETKRANEAEGRAREERERAREERERAERLAAKLRALGIDPEE
jgi:Uma2 family endonuclease